MKNLLPFLFAFFLCCADVAAQETKRTPEPAKKDIFDTPQKPKRPPQTPEEFYEAARYVNWNERKKDEAIKLLDRALALKPDYADAFLLRGHLKNDKKDCRGAIEDFTAVIELAPEAPNSYQYRAECKIALNDLAGALRDFDKSVSLFAAEGKVQYNAFQKRGKLKYLLKDYAGAIADFTKAGRITGGIDARFLRALTYLKAGDRDSAISDFTWLVMYSMEIGKLVREKFPDNYKENKNYPEDENPLAPPKPVTKLTEAEPTIMVRSVAVGRSGGGEGAFDDFADFEDKIKPDGWFYSADKVYLPTMGFNDEAPVFMYYLADLLEKKGDTTAAIKTFTEAIIYKQYDDDLIRFRRGRLFLQTGEYEAAVRDFSWTISQNRRFADAFLERGIALMMLGRDDLARKDLAGYEKLNPTPEAGQMLADRVAEAKKLREELKKTPSEKK